MTHPEFYLKPVSPSLHCVHTEKVAILDCGAQYTKVIDRRVRELNIFSEILPLSVASEALDSFSAIIISGGPNSVFADDAPYFDKSILQLGIPVLGICYGMQLIAYYMGGKVEAGTIKEFGETKIATENDSPLFFNLPKHHTVLMSHGDRVTKLPEGFMRIASSGDITAAMMNMEQSIYGVQFHPEVELTEHGEAIISNFLYKIAGLHGQYPLETRLHDTIEQLQQAVGKRNVFVLVSGGVDSAVTAALLIKSLEPNQVFALHMDTGFMRHEESDTVCNALKAMGMVNLKHLKVGEQFLNACTCINGKTIGPLKSLTCPEEKRRVIGDMFFQLTQDSITSMGLNLDETFIAQGTLRPDLIESGNTDISQIAHKIKTHHNDVPVIQAQREKGLIIEPNRDWHKDEVRKIGAMLGLPEEVVQRQPFPGPGLAIRILCTDKPYLTDEFDTLNESVNLMAKDLNLQGNILPVQSVGVQGDYRSYSYLATLSGNYPQDWDGLKSLALKIPNRMHSINRVALVLNKNLPMPQVIKQIVPTNITHDTLELLRKLDFEVTEAFRKADRLSLISQLLTVLVPVSAQSRNHRSVAIRAVITSDYMTARPARLGDEIQWELMHNLSHKITNEYPVDWVMYDLTSKPPATVEWE